MALDQSKLLTNLLQYNLGRDNDTKKGGNPTKQTRPAPLTYNVENNLYPLIIPL